MKILGIESSCDETAAAVVENGYHLISSTVASSMDLHIQYGGVVPEVAARSHIEVIIPVLEETLENAKSNWSDIDAIGVTYGAGLSGSLLIGVLSARTLAIALNKPLYAINHVEAHVYANFLTSSDVAGLIMPPSQPAFPMLAIIVSGGHSQLALFRNHFDYTLLGQTQDDAIGEAFDKVAKILGLPYPGGPSIEKLAKTGDSKAYKLPKAKMPGYDFSFSGPKTAVLRVAQAEVGENYDFPSIKLPERLNLAQKANIAASFERSAFETIVNKAKRAYEEYSPASVVLAGGVAASQTLRNMLSEAIPIKLSYPDPRLCTDNAAMVATLGYYKHSLGQTPADPFTLDVAPSLSM
ncbi:MAG TPA: tRNA (adenosine(37)-N6)-threonylcarbamoyltransferase complex transferase subunit TsaD [Candidatus Saccharimonadales bacterium]|nr:tRNA (adenosine(37)-N6)-threonylcarbamoyltransferase complex transferase subunit TsaD [Candidatus Saccharimonadales bacterium]